MKMRTHVLAAAALVAVSGSAAEAQVAAPIDARQEISKADELQQEAESLFAQPRHWKRAVQLLERSAGLRSADDPEAYTSYVLAGRLAAVLGDGEAALRLLRAGADHALARGAVIDAASAFIDAAHAAARAGDADEARTMLDRATLLAGSPMLTDRQREAIVYRLDA